MYSALSIGCFKHGPVMHTNSNHEAFSRVTLDASKNPLPSTITASIVLSLEEHIFINLNLNRDHLAIGIKPMASNFNWVFLQPLETDVMTFPPPVSLDQPAHVFSLQEASPAPEIDKMKNLSKES